LGGVGTSGRGRRRENGEGGIIGCKYCLHMFANGKMIPVETIPGIGGMKDNGGGHEFKYDIVDILEILL
jgi:hypothetical protein